MVTLLLPALKPADCVRHWPVALLLAASGAGFAYSRVDARLALARCKVDAFESRARPSSRNSFR